MRAFKTKKGSISIVKFQKFFEINFKLQKFFEVLMLLLLYFYPNFSYLSDLTTTLTTREFQRFFDFHSFRRYFNAARS